MFKLAWRGPYVGMAGAGENWNGLGGALGGGLRSTAGCVGEGRERGSLGFAKMKSI